MENMEDIAYRRFTREWLLKELPDTKDVMKTFDTKAKEKGFT